MEPQVSGTGALGETIRGLRKRAHLTQEQLAEGICSAVSVSRIENGRQMPTKAVLDALLARLGSGTYELAGIYAAPDDVIFDDALKAAYRLVDEGKPREAASQLEILRAHAGSMPRRRQYCLFLEGLVARAEGAPSSEVLDVLERALRATKPEIDLDDFRHVALDPVEANIVHDMVFSLGEGGRRRDAIRLGEELALSLDALGSDLSEHVLLRINLAISLARYCGEEGRDDEAFEHICLAEKLSLANREHALLPEVFYFKAVALERRGEDAQARELLCAVVPYARLIGKDELVRAASEYARDRMGLKL